MRTKPEPDSRTGARWQATTRGEHTSAARAPRDLGGSNLGYTSSRRLLMTGSRRAGCFAAVPGVGLEGYKKVGEMDD